MHTLPAATLRLYATTGESFATAHFIVDPHPKKLRGDCIFTIDPEHEQSTLGEVRWLIKRRVETAGEHKFRIDPAGVLTIESGGFELVMKPTEHAHEMRTTPSGPQLSGYWQVE